MTSAPAIGFEYRPSRWPPRLLVLVALLAVVAVMLCALGTWLKLLLIGAACVATVRAVRRAVRSRVVAAGWNDGEWSLRLVEHEDVPATLASFRVLGAFVLLRLRTSGLGMQVLLLAPDNSDADIRRRLRMRLATQLGEAKPRS